MEASSNGPYTGQPLYNGNISETYWRSGNDNVLRKYGYFYDDLNRLKAAWYMKPGIPNEVAHSYDESLKYDKNGNIMKLLRNGYLDSDSGDTANIDNLTYTYTANTNRLARISDSTYFTNGFTDGANLANEYLYDDKGNMVSDLNKGIENITYNQLNLPTKIEIAEGITYRYDANGVKMQKTVTLDNVASTIDYLWGYQYKDGVLQFFPTAEGYVSDVLDEGTDHFNYVYNYTDHLGNIRLSYSKSETGALKIMEENNYYPFGLKHENYNVQKYTYTTFGDVRVGPRTIVLEAVERMGYQYKYNGKEYQDELGLNLYDYGARNYDPAIGRWMNIDPLSEVSRRWSPYSFSYNNPVRFIDPDGMLPTDTVNDNDDIVITGNQKEATLEQLNKGSELTFTMNDAGKVSASQDFVGPLTEADTELQSATTDSSFTASINSTDGFVSTDGTGAMMSSLGAFDGSVKNADGTMTANQTVNPDFGAKVDNHVGRPEGTGVVHETLEAIQEAKRAVATGKPADFKTDPKAAGANYKPAHAKARALDPRHTDNYDNPVLKGVRTIINSSGVPMPLYTEPKK